MKKAAFCFQNEHKLAELNAAEHHLSSAHSYVFAYLQQVWMENLEHCINVEEWKQVSDNSGVGRTRFV